MIKRNIIFQLESRKKKGVTIVENVPIRMRVIFPGNRIEFSTGYRIDAAKWDANKQRVKNGCTNKLKQSASEINAELNRYESIIQNIFKEYEVNDLTPSSEELKRLFNKRVSAEEEDDVSFEEIITVPEEPQKTFWEVYSEFMKENGRMNDWTDATYEKFIAFKNHLKKFKAFAEVESFDFFTESGLNDLVIHFRDKCDMLNSTIGKQLGFLKWFLKWAAAKGYHTNLAFASFKPKLKNTQSKVIFLTDEEMALLKSYDIPDRKKYLERTRDVLLFCCYTGLRYSDVANLRTSDVRPNHIEITTVKTADSLIIELNKHSRAILDKYQDIPFPDCKVLPVVSNQKMNDYIKELGELVGIDTPVRITRYKGNQRIDSVLPKYQLLCTHTGRKTFICKALALGIPPSVVMKWTGHSDYKAMKPYIAIADETRVSAMSRFDMD